eukprot:COSAG02_NODE_1685_length_11320_cov_4.020408_6_plen_101_part_00
MLLANNKSATDCRHCAQYFTGSLFSNDPELIELYHEVRLPLTAMMVTFAMAVFLERIPMTMGRTKLVMNVGLLGSWVGQVRSDIFPHTGFAMHSILPVQL